MLILLILLLSVKAFYEVPLKIAYLDEKRSKILLNMKFKQQQMYTSFLQTKTKKSEDKRLATFYGEISIDQQQFKVIFDTGSCEFWVPGNDCNTKMCQKHHKLNSTYEKIENKTLLIYYMSGRVKGDIIKKSCDVSGLQIDNINLGVAQEINIPILEDVEWDGIVGLAFANKKLQLQKILPFFDSLIESETLKKNNLPNQFAYYIGNNEGSLILGGYDKRFQLDEKQNLTWLPIKEHYYWTISLVDIRKEFGAPQQMIRKTVQEDTIRMCPKGCNAIMDTGTFLIYGPKDIIEEYFNSFDINDCSKMNQLPNIVFEFIGGDQNIEFLLTPQDYMVQFTMDGKQECVLGIQADDSDEWTLGQIFLKKFYSIYDRDNSRIGFVESNPNPIKSQENQDNIKSIIIQKTVQTNQNNDNLILANKFLQSNILK